MYIGGGGQYISTYVGECQRVLFLKLHVHSKNTLFRLSVLYLASYGELVEILGEGIRMPLQTMPQHTH